MLRACLYTRVSTVMQAEEGYSLAEQQRALTDYCRANEVQIVEHVSDDGVSGRLRDRPAVQRLLQLADAQAFDILILVKLDRIGRSNHVIQELLYEVRSRGVRVLFLEHGGGDTASDRLLLNVLGGVAEYQWEEIRALTMKGRMAKARQGLIPSNLWILGYDVVRKWQVQVDASLVAGQLVINAAEAALVRRIFAEFDAGRSVQAMLRELRAEGHRGKRGSLLGASTLRSILGNPTYLGALSYGRGASPASVACPPLVTPDAWQRCQARLRDQAAQVGRPTDAFPLRGCIVCATCTGQRGTPRALVARRNTHEARAGGWSGRSYRCGGCHGNFDAVRLETRCLRELRQALEPGELGRMAAAVATAELAAAGDVGTRLRKTQELIRGLDAEERQVADMIRVGLSPHIVAEQVARIQGRRRQAEADLAAAAEQVGRIGDPQAVAARAEAVATAARAGLEQIEADPIRLRAYFRQFIRVTARKGKPPQIEVRARQ